MSREHQSKGVQELYPSERNALVSIRHSLMQELSFKAGTEDDLKRRFTEQAKNRCGAIGLVVDIQWEYDVSDNPEDTALYLNPRIIVNDRANPEPEVDHDRMKTEVRSGEADGKAGLIDPNDPDRKLRADSKKKNIL